MNGLFFHSENKNESDGDLIEVGKYDHINIDDRVICWNKDNLKDKVTGHFAGLTIGGRPRIYGGGRTSFTVKNKHSGFRIFNNCELYKDE